MRTSRLEAFSDGVLAIIITIMVLELHVPEGARLEDLADSTTGFLTYLLSFVYIGIFWLSLFPFTTAWMDETELARTPLVVYGANLLAAAIAYFLLEHAIFRAEGPDGLLRQALGRDVKGKVSPLIYVAGILTAAVAGWPALILYTFVAAMWLVPDRRLETYVAEHGLAE